MLFHLNLLQYSKDPKIIFLVRSEKKETFKNIKIHRDPKLLNNSVVNII